ncbi:MAG: type II CAAX prenyl endopeptidase Rce1 family protein [Acidimicrobiales bacterium]
MPELVQPPGSGGTSNPGWYPDPWGRSAWRWWDGWSWTGWISPPEGVGPGVVRRLVVEPTPFPPAPPEAPGRERLPGGAPAGVGPLETAGREMTPFSSGMAAPHGGVGPVPSMGSGIRPSGPPRPVPPAGRRRLVVELLIVLAVFPLPYVISALQALVAYLLGEGAGKRIPVLFPGHMGAGFPFVLVEVLLPLAAGALVLYLLSLPGGDGGPAAIGLDRQQVRADLALLLPVFALCDLIPIVGGSLALHALGVHNPSPATGGVPAYYGVAYVAMAVVAGVVEELVVLGYLVRRLEQLGLRPLWVVVLAVAVRGSYHLYYGWGVLPLLLWATASVLLYRRYRRLAPFIVVHALWDSGIFLSGHFLAAEVLILTPLTIAFTATWWRYLPARAERSGR